jgi:CDP-diacylglycerol--glycerol-3-phosphate 3-phosphatidyltransferase
MNLPNSITMSRIASVPLLIWIMSPHGLHTMNAILPAASTGLRGAEQEIVASIVFIMASITDGLDGYLARRRKQITTMGMLLDPLADKLMVTAAFIILVAYNPRLVPPWIAVVVIGREFLVSGLRSIASAEGFTIEASEIGKLKTVIQIVSVVAAILAHRWDYWNWGGFIVAVHFIAVTAIYWMTIVSIISAVDYFVGFWKKIDHASDKRRGRRTAVLSRRKAPQTNSPAA